MKSKISLTPKFLIKQKWERGVRTSSPLKVPFKIIAEEFLDFAKQDINEDSLHGDVNVITNVKRCIENRLDSLLFLFGYYEIAEREKWSFPKKLNILEKLGIKAPQILHRKINLRRVMVEHRYEKPPRHEDILDLIDISELFLNATDNFIRKTIIDAEASIEKKGLIQLYLSMILEIGKGKITVQIFGGSDKPGHYGPLEKELSLGIDDNDYSDWIRLLIKLAY